VAFPFIGEDLRGTTRTAKTDIGAQQRAPSPGTRRPLTPADVGPEAP
jgi:hypothetical protein